LAVGWSLPLVVPPQPVFATATQSTENLTAATGFLDQNAEAIIYLDHVTGELSAHVINTNSWQIFASYNYKGVNADLGVAASKNPKYSLVTGLLSFKPKGQNRLASCVVYVAEEATGQFAAYGIPWESSMMNRPGTPPVGRFILLGKGKTSTAAGRGAAAGAK
jgi:hypothetical protein